MDTVASLAAGLAKTPARGWLVVLLSRLQGSSVVLLSYSFGHIPPNLVVAPRASHNTLDLSMRYPHHVFLRANGI